MTTEIKIAKFYENGNEWKAYFYPNGNYDIIDPKGRFSSYEAKSQSKAQSEFNQFKLALTSL